MPEQSRDLTPRRADGSPSPSALDVLAGAAGLGGRASVTVVNVVTASISPAARPAAALARAGWRSPVGAGARSAVSEALDSLETSGRADRERAGATIDRFVDTVLDRLAGRLVRAGLVERLTAELIAAGVPERVAEQIVESNFYDDAVDRILESEELWRIVNRIAQSPEVMSAITSGGATSLAGEVTGQVKRRTEVADEIAERIVGRVLRLVPRERRW